MFRRAGPVSLLCCEVMIAAGLYAAAAYAMPASGPQGDWLTANGHGVIEIAPCGEALCGRIVGIDRAPAAPIPTDALGRSQCGLTIISDEKPDDPGSWLGEITDPRNGDSYHARLSVDDQGDLRLRVFVGLPVLGETQVWRRFTGQLDRACRIE